MNQPLLVRRTDIGFSVIKNIGVTVRVIVDILQLHVTAAHTAHISHTAAHIAYAAHTSRHIAEHVLRHILRHVPGHTLRHATGRRTVASTGCERQSSIPRESFAAFRRRVLRLPGLEAILLSAVRVHKVPHIESPAVPAAAAEAGAVRLVQFTVVTAIITLEEGVFYPLYCQIKPPILAIDSKVSIAAKGRIHAKFPHHTVCQVVLHIGCILDCIIQTQLIQTVVALRAVVLVELDFEAVPVAAHRGDRRQRRVALCPDTHIPVSLTIDHHSADGVLLVLTSVNESLPVIHHDVDRMDPPGIKNPLLISHHAASRLKAKRLTVDKPHCQNYGTHQNNDTNTVNMFMR